MYRSIPYIRTYYMTRQHPRDKVETSLRVTRLRRSECLFFSLKSIMFNQSNPDILFMILNIGLGLLEYVLHRQEHLVLYCRGISHYVHVVWMIMSCMSCWSLEWANCWSGYTGIYEYVPGYVGVSLTTWWDNIPLILLCWMNCSTQLTGGKMIFQKHR